MAEEYKAGRPTKLSPELEEKARDYLITYDTVVPTVQGLALYLHVNSDTLYQWKEKSQVISDTLREIKEKQGNLLIDGGLKGTLNPTITKLLLSANHGLVEKSAQDITSKDEQIQFINTVPRS